MIVLRKITAALIGAGGRGYWSYGSYAWNYPHELQFVAVAEPLQERREKFQQKHGIAAEKCFANWEELLSQPKMADAILICTQDRMHFAPAMAAMAKGYHVLLEKPMAVTPEECITLGATAAKSGRLLLICHVLRYTPFFQTLKRVLDEGRIGRLICIQHNENVGYYHYAHSFIRGHWRNSNTSSPMILAKSCHDMDIMLWLAGADCAGIASYGSLTHFKPENAPAGAPARCLDGCPAERTCPFYAPRIYQELIPQWLPVDDNSPEARFNTLREHPLGRCVYHCDNNVVDHQVVSLEFTNEVTASFTMCGFTRDISRTLKLMGTKGEIRGAMEQNEIEIHDFVAGGKETIRVKEPMDGHGGGDYGIIREFVRLVEKDGAVSGPTAAEISVQSHLMAFAAEKSRLEKKMIKMDDYKKGLA